MLEAENALSKSATTIVAAAELENGACEHNDPRDSPKSRLTIAGTLHNIGLTIIVISIMGSLRDSIVVSRRLTELRWISWFNRFAPYSLWGGLLLVFAGIVVRDRSWRRKPPS
jgi:uncharacterized DUF497 family protein